MEQIDKFAKNILPLVKKYFTGMVDKGGHPYIEHLYNVANKSKKIAHELGYNQFKVNQIYIVGWLHDILEDTSCTKQELIDIGCDEEIIEAILAITRNPEEEKYFDFIKRVKKNPIARLVKIADLENNMDITRLNKFGEYEKNRLMKYWYSRKYLNDEFTEEQCSQIKDMK